MNEVNAKELSSILSLRKEKSKESDQLMHYGLFQEAIDVNLTMIDINHGDQKAYNRLGDALLKIGKSAEAHDAYQSSIYLEKAKKENKLLLISIGYSACHWCHVMEHESFEDSVVAKVMNDNFICIKVDREERPDVDQIYMTAVQLMNNRGGWPLNCIALPDGRPFWGGTYFRKEE